MAKVELRRRSNTYRVERIDTVEVPSILNGLTACPADLVAGAWYLFDRLLSNDLSEFQALPQFPWCRNG